VPEVLFAVHTTCPHLVFSTLPALGGVERPPAGRSGEDGAQGVDAELDETEQLGVV
jgi:hypothetical protein